MATTQPPQPRIQPPPNQVSTDGVLKEQVVSEDLACKSYDRKWRFLCDFEKLHAEEAKKFGFSEEEFKRVSRKKRPGKTVKYFIKEPPPSDPIPITSTGMIGWRSSRSDCRLEMFGRFQAVSNPPLDPPGRPPTPPYKHICLG